MLRQVNAMIMLFILIITLGACKYKDSNETTTEKLHTPNSTSNNTAIGGMSNSDYERKYTREFSIIPGIFADIVGYDEFNNWAIEYSNKKRDSSECNQLIFINEFNISKDLLLDEINKNIGKVGTNINITGWDSRLDIYPLTDEQIDIMYSGDMELINKTFVNRAAILYKNKIYAARWIAENDIEKIREAGIPLSILEEKINVWKNEETLFIGAENRQVLHDKVTAYKNAYGAK